MNILILTGSFGMGHNAAADAVAEKVKRELKSSSVTVVDLFSYAFNSQKYNVFFRLMIKGGKRAYNYVYLHTADSQRNRKLPFQKMLQRGLGELINATRPDVIVSTLWSCSKAVSDYKCRTGKSLPLITCITDVSSHSEWIQPGTDFYISAAPEIRNELIGKGIEPQRIIVAGVPVRSGFRAQAAREKPAAEKKLLIMGGGLGLLPKNKAFYEALDTLQDVKTTVITGSNVSLYKALHGRYGNIEVLGFVEDVPKYMGEADLLVTKPGGITVFEAIASELPLLVFRPFLGQEKRNSEFILGNGMGAVLPADPEQWVPEIRAALGDELFLGSAGDHMRVFKSLLDEDALQRLLRQYERQCA